jgi:sugar phosphate isomerase/epimerase
VTLRIGASSGAFYTDIPTEDVPARAASLGFRDVELMLQTAGEYDAGFMRRVRANADGAGVCIHSLHLFQSLHPFFTGYQRRTDEALDLFRRALDGAHICGARILVWHGASRAEATAPNAWDRFIAMTEQLAEVATEAGVTLGIENVSWCVISAVRDVLRLNGALAAMPHADAVGYVFDTFQALESGANPFMLLAAMEDRLVDVHISDGRDGDRTHRHLLPGQGELPWPALVKAIAASGFGGPMMLEAPIADQAAVDHVRAVLDPLLAAAAADDPCAEPLPEGVRAGIALFNAGRYYEAHEEIEHEWHAERRPIRLLYQGILQIGVGLHHARGGNHRGAVLLLTDGIAKVSQFLPACQGVPTAVLAQAAQACLDQVIELGAERLAEFDWSKVPVITIDAPAPPGDKCPG